MNTEIEKKLEGLKILTTYMYGRKVFFYVLANPNTNVSTIYKDLRIEQSVTSAVLSQLRKANLVIGKRSGREMLYTVNKKGLREYANLFKELSQNVAP